MNKNFIVLFLYIMCILLNIFDIFSTYIILQNAGEESNFIMKYSIELFGSFWGLIYPKIITLFLISLLVYFYFKKITTERTLARIIVEYDPGDKVVLKILRDNLERNVEVVLGERESG